jgi:hypothetical protein
MSKWRLTAQALATYERLKVREDAGPSLTSRAWERYVRRLGAFYAEKELQPSASLLAVLAPEVKAQFRNPHPNPNPYPRGRWT